MELTFKIFSFSLLCLSLASLGAQGRSPVPKIQGRIINGHDAQEHEFPWMVMLNTPEGEQFCGGSLISENFVLTAAHCMLGDPESYPKSVVVKFGAHDKRRNESETFVIGIRRLSRHPNYVNEGIISDIALLELDKSVPISDVVHPICIPSEEDDFSGLIGVISGWGLVTPGGVGSDVLQKAEIPILSHPTCQEIYGSVITEDMICAGGQGSDTCQKDSGGPMMYNDPQSGWVLVGITSWGEGCGKKAGVFSSVAYASTWIRKMVKEPSLCLK